MREIPLTQGKVALVDDEDYERVSKYKWYINNGYARTDVGPNGKPIYLHRFIMYLYDESVRLDHINDNRCDDRKSNLRVATSSQNRANMNKPVGGTSKYKGVSWDKAAQKWRASIRVDYKKKFLGLFVNEEDAARTYDEAALKYFGEFARINGV